MALVYRHGFWLPIFKIEKTGYVRLDMRPELDVPVARQISAVDSPRLRDLTNQKVTATSAEKEIISQLYPKKQKVCVQYHVLP